MAAENKYYLSKKSILEHSNGFFTQKSDSDQEIFFENETFGKLSVAEKEVSLSKSNFRDYMLLNEVAIQGYINNPQYIDEYLKALYPYDSSRYFIIINAGNCADAIRYKNMYPKSTVVAFESAQTDDAELLIQKNKSDVILMDTLISFKNGFDYVFPPNEKKKIVECQTMNNFYQSVNHPFINFIDFKNADPEVLLAFGDALRYNVMAILLQSHRKDYKENLRIMIQNNFTIFDPYNIEDGLKYDTLYINETYFKKQGVEEEIEESEK
jgi:hypothetical protein